MGFTAIDYASFGLAGAVVIFLTGITLMGSAEDMEDSAGFSFLATGIYAIGWVLVEIGRLAGGWSHEQHIHISGIYFLPFGTHVLGWAIRKRGWELINNGPRLSDVGISIAGGMTATWLVNNSAFLTMMVGMLLAHVAIALIRFLVRIGRRG